MAIIKASERDLEVILSLCKDCSQNMENNLIDQWDDIYPNREVFLNDIGNDSLYILVSDKEALWAELEDARTLPVDVSLKLIETLHCRWVTLLKSLSQSELNRQFYHPEAGDLSLNKVIGLYAWHGNHHLAHIMNFRKSVGL